MIFVREQPKRKCCNRSMNEWEPDLVTCNPPCGPWCQFQRLNKNVESVMEQRQEDLTFWRFVAEVWKKQNDHCRLVLSEQPWQSEALHLNFMEERKNLHRAKVAQCAFGLVDKVSGKPHQKYTALDVNHPTMKHYLEERGRCIHATGEHQPIEGMVFWKGGWWKRSTLAARWPRRLCSSILEAAEAALKEVAREVHDADHSLVAPNQDWSHFALPVEPVPTPEGEMRRQMEKFDNCGSRYDYVYFEGEARQVPQRIRQALAHLHVALGHPSMERLVRMLVVSGSSASVLKAAKGMNCQVCQSVKPPGAEPKVSGQRVTRFGDKVLSDSFYVWDGRGERFNVTHVIDALTEYHIGTVSKQPSAQFTAEILQDKWCAIFGPPEILQTDGGLEYADVVQRISRILDFRHEVVPPGAKWRQGQVERHGGIVKLMIMRTVNTVHAVGLEEMKLVVAACFSAKNRMANRAGLSPPQAVTGRNTSVPLSIMDQLATGCVKQAVNEELVTKDALRRSERIRAAACDSFHWIDSNEVLRRALHARSRPPKLEMLQEGATVYVYDPPPARRGLARRMQDHSSWDGPALVICVEKHQNVPNRVWVRLRSKVKSYPLEKVRLATPDEMLGSSFVLQAMDELADKLKGGNLLLEENQSLPAIADGPAPYRPDQAKEFDDGIAETGGEIPEGMHPEVDTEADRRAEKVRRLELLNDVPVSIRHHLEAASSSPSSTLA